MRILNEQAKLNLPVSPMLFLEFHGTEAATRDQVRIFEEIARSEGAGSFEWAEKEEDRRRLWKARHESYWSVKGAYPSREAIATDVCVPISRLAECVAETVEDIRASGLAAPIVGHVGDGNFHTMPMVDMSNPRDIEAAEKLIERMAKRAIAMEGTCTGEHGIGQGKIKYLNLEHGAAIATMRAIKKALDPQDLLNPGKILPAP